MVLVASASIAYENVILGADGENLNILNHGITVVKTQISLKRGVMEIRETQNTADVKQSIGFHCIAFEALHLTTGLYRPITRFLN